MSHVSRGFLLACLVGCTSPSPGPTTTSSTSSASVVLKSHARMMRAQPGEMIEPGATATESAQALVARLAPRWGVAHVPALEPRGEVPIDGATIVRLAQVIDGIPVEAGELHVMVKPGGELVAASGVPASADVAREAPRFSGTPADAVTRAIAAVKPATRAVATPGKSMAQQVWHRDGDRLIAAWLVEAYLEDGDLVRTVIAASDGRVLSTRSLVANDAFQYTVWADTAPELHPHDSPNADFCPYPFATEAAGNGAYPSRVAPANVSVTGNNHPAGAQTPDPWLPAGATQTQGNNIDAYVDLSQPDGLSPGDFRASTTAAGQFLRSYDFSKAPNASQAQQMASTTAMFFTLNWMHDFWYDAGFVETANNAQMSNYGRGGVEGDPLLAEGQDYSGRDNANMSTPDDGMSPRMQMYIWDGADTTTATVGGGTHKAGGAGFGPDSFTLTGQVVAAQDGTSTLACTAITNNVSGKIALVDRGTCAFQKKAANVQAAGAIGMIVVDNQTAATPPSMPPDGTSGTITIDAVSVTKADGAALRAALPVSTTLTHAKEPDIDGALDATVIGHEDGHYVHHRLQQCGTAMCDAMSEGWADFSALLLTTRAGDDFQHAAFPLAQFATKSFADPGYFGIRRVPYSIVTTIDPLTFIDMASGQALPTTAPIASSGAGDNAEAHNAGEVWATMMFEVYAAIQAEAGDFTTARSRMAKDVVAGLLMAPPDSTPTEMRDAIIAAADQLNPGDGMVVASAFARRGLGSCAVSPPRDSSDFTGIVESTELAGNPNLGEATLGDAGCGTNDGSLDSGQTMMVTVPFANDGFFAVDGVNVAVTSPTPGLTIDNATDAVGTMTPGQHHDLALTLHYDGGAMKGTPVAGELDIAVTATNGCAAQITRQIPIRLDVNDTIDGETTDHFDTAASVWASSSDASWQHVRKTALDGAWHGEDLGRPSNGFLASPPLNVASDQDFTVSFTHKYSFEYSMSTAWDAGVVEYSVDNGTTWMDVTTLTGVDASYGADLVTDQSGNALAGRKGYTGTNASYPNTDMVTLAFGKQLAGQTVRLRFLIGTDAAQGDAGWDIDDVAVTGITNAPFGSEVPANGVCLGPSEAGDGGGGSGSGGCCDAAPLSGGNVLISLMIMGGIVRRRRNCGR